jgi:hypothetical protein
VAAVRVLECDLFRETAAIHLKPGSSTEESFQNFIATKIQNPIASYGKSDKANPAGTPMAQYVPKIRHAHLTHDISIFYTISGSNPSELRLYGVLTHDEAGTGQPVNNKRQKSVAKRFSNQDFN